MSDIGYILTISFFIMFFTFLTVMAQSGECENNVIGLNETLDTNDWYSGFTNYYNILTFKGCNNDNTASWFYYLIITPITISMIYLFARLVRGGG